MEQKSAYFTSGLGKIKIVLEIENRVATNSINTIRSE